MYYLPKSVLSTNSNVLSTNYMYYPPTQILLSTNSGHSDLAMPGLLVAVDAQIDP